MRATLHEDNVVRGDRFDAKDNRCSAAVHGHTCLLSLCRAVIMPMSVKVYGSNHVAIEVTDIDKAVAFYEDLFGLEKLDEGEGDAFFKIGEHQFLAMFEVKEMKADRVRHFGLIVRDDAQIAEVRGK